MSNDTEPRIVEFPGDIVRAIEGQRVEFIVKVMGEPEIKLTWYHDGEEVVTNYSTDLGLDGCLTISCSETSHTGTYQLVAANSHGRAEREVKLFVRKERQPSPEPTSNKTKVSLSPISILEFGEYVASGHTNDNDIFKEQFTVNILCVRFC